MFVLTKIDAVGKPSWQAQIKGTKQWILEPPPECYFQCRPKHVVVVQPGDISKYWKYIFSKPSSEKEQIQQIGRGWPRGWLDKEEVEKPAS